MTITPEQIAEEAAKVTQFNVNLALDASHHHDFGVHESAIAYGRLLERGEQAGPVNRWPLRHVLAEVERATAKFPTWPTDPLHAVAILGEEFGELIKEALQFVYEPHKTNREKVRAESIQTAAMALRFLMSLDRYEYRRGEQHEQNWETT